MGGIVLNNYLAKSVFAWYKSRRLTLGSEMEEKESKKPKKARKEGKGKAAAKK